MYTIPVTVIKKEKKIKIRHYAILFTEVLVINTIVGMAWNTWIAL